jgi:hypothetical protein
VEQRQKVGTKQAGGAKGKQHVEVEGETSDSGSSGHTNLCTHTVHYNVQ